MVYPFLCGAVHHQGEDDDIFWVNSVSSPRKTRRRKDNKNPYATRGLDQFYALLDELEQKRQQIYSKTGPQGIIRFVYKNSNDCVPVLIKLKDDNNNKKKKELLDKNKLQVSTKLDENVSEVVLDKLQVTPLDESDKGIIEKKSSFSWRNNVKCSSSRDWRRPCCVVPAAVILILLFLVFFGRSGAIMCTCVGWYVVPSLSGEGSDQFRTSMKKKDYGRKLSRTKLVSGKLLYSYQSNKF